MDLIQELTALGCNTAEGLERFMGNAGLYEKMLRKFPASCAPMDSLGLIRAGKVQEAVECTHTLKGMTGNLSLTPLFEGYTEIVAELRAGNVEKALCVLEGILPVQDKIISLLV